jgi:hypothetical protein
MEYITKDTDPSTHPIHVVLSKWMNGEGENTPPPLSPSRRVNANTSGSPWKRHIQLLTDAKVRGHRGRAEQSNRTNERLND